MSLARLFVAERAPDDVVAVGVACERTAGRLAADAFTIAQALPPATPDRCLGLAFTDDPWAFAAALLAAWRTGHRTALAEHAWRERVVPLLQRPDLALLVHDTGSGRGLSVPKRLASAQPPSTDAAWQWLLGDAPPVTLECHATDADGVPVWRTVSQAQALALLGQLTALLPSRSGPPRARRFAPSFPRALFDDLLLPLSRGESFALDAAPSDAATTIDLPLPWPQRSRLADHEVLTALRGRAGIEDLAAFAVPSSDAPHDPIGAVVLLAGPAAMATAAALPSLDIDGLQASLHAADRIPRDPNHLPCRSDVLLACGRGRDGARVQREAGWRALPPDGETLRLQATLPNRYAFHEGHFTGYPVLAGGAQLHELVLPALRRCCAALPDLLRIDGVKFLARILPGDVVDVNLTPHPDGVSIGFGLDVGSRRCTSGRLTFATALQLDHHPDGR